MLKNGSYRPQESNKTTSIGTVGCSISCLLKNNVFLTGRSCRGFFVKEQSPQLLNQCKRRLVHFKSVSLPPKFLERLPMFLISQTFFLATSKSTEFSYFAHIMIYYTSRLQSQVQWVVGLFSQTLSFILVWCFEFKTNQLGRRTVTSEFPIVSFCKNFLSFSSF